MSSVAWVSVMSHRTCCSASVAVGDSGVALAVHVSRVPQDNLTSEMVEMLNRMGTSLLTTAIQGTRTPTHAIQCAPCVLLHVLLCVCCCVCCIVCCCHYSSTWGVLRVLHPALSTGFRSQRNAFDARNLTTYERNMRLHIDEAVKTALSERCRQEVVSLTDACRMCVRGIT